MAAALCLAIAIVAGLTARAEATRAPTAAERAAAEATAVAQRWRTWSAGRIFPASLSYTTSLLTTETATRVVIATRTSCADALDPSLAALTASGRCQAGLRAAYLDQPQGIVYTVGVLAFPSARLAAAFARRLPASGASALALRAVELPGTATALDSPQSRQAATSRTAGPFVVLTVASYADGEPAGPGQEPRTAIFAPASQLAGDVAGPLSAPAHVNCASPQWSC